MSTTDQDSYTYAYATPDYVMSALAYRLLSTTDCEVYVSTERNYTYASRAESPTEPGDTISMSPHLRPVGNHHPFTAGDGTWSEVARYLDDRITEAEHPYSQDAYAVCGPWDEYFILVPGTGYSDYGGGTVNESNFRSFVRDYPDTFVEATGYHGSSELYIPVMVPADPNGINTVHYDPEESDTLASEIEGLEGYPLYDEEDHSDLEREKLEELTEDSWWQDQVKEGVAAVLTDLILDDAYPLESCNSDACQGGCDGRNRASTNGIDTYDFEEAVKEWLNEAGDVFLDWDYGYYGDWLDAANQSVYTLVSRYAEENCHVIYEDSGVCITHAEENYGATARHIWRNRNKLGDRAPWPAFPVPSDYMS